MCYSSDRVYYGNELATVERFTSYLAKCFFIQQVYMKSLMYQVMSAIEIIKAKFLPLMNSLTSGRDWHINRYFKMYEQAFQFATAFTQVREWWKVRRESQERSWHGKPWALCCTSENKELLSPTLVWNARSGVLTSRTVSTSFPSSGSTGTLRLLLASSASACRLEKRWAELSLSPPLAGAHFTSPRGDHMLQCMPEFPGQQLIVSSFIPISVLVWQ